MRVILTSILIIFNLTYTFQDPLKIVRTGNCKGLAKTESVIYNWSAGVWDNYRKDIYQYNTAGNIFEDLTLDWNGSQWINYMKYTYQYDDIEELITGYLGEEWVTDHWENYSQAFYTYDDYERMIELFTQNWSGSEWVNAWKYTYEYTGEGLQFRMTMQEWVTDHWENYWRSTYSYNDSNELIEDLMEMWEGSSWDLYYRYDYVYSLGLRDTQTAYYYSGGWNLSLQYLYEYDEFDRNDLKTGQIWISTYWQNNSREENTFDPFNNIIETLNMTWNADHWENSTKTINTYEETSIENRELKIKNYSLSQNYPNPFNPTTTITYSLDEVSEVQLNVFNTTGEIVSELVNKIQDKGIHTFEFDAAGLNSGIYFYKLILNGNSEIKKMILMK